MYFHLAPQEALWGIIYLFSGSLVLVTNMLSNVAKEVMALL